MKNLILGLLVAVPISLQWQPLSSNQRGFNVYWDKGLGTWEKLSDVGNNITYKGTLELDPTKKTCFAVTAYNELGETSRSTSICKSKPAAPIGVTEN